MFALAALMTAVVEVTHFVGVATLKHVGHQAIIVRPLVTRMGMLKHGPVIGKDLLEDTPVPQDVCHHQAAPSERDQVVWMKRFYHASAVSSTPDRPTLGYSQSPRLSLSHGDFWDRENAFSYAIEIIEH